MKKRAFLPVSALILSLLFISPWLLRDFVGIEHDTFFHLSRIEGLASALKCGDFLPALYPYKNNGFGYAGPLFYCDLFVLPAALLYLLKVPLSACYVFTVFLYTFFTAYFTMRLCLKLTDDHCVSLLVTAAFLFCNYRITDVYVRSAMGETAAMMFLPFLLEGLYDVLEKKRTQSWKLLCAGLLGLVFSHNLTFLFGVVLYIAAALLYRAWREREVMTALCKAALTACLLSLWFTIPMLEQLASQEMFVGWYAANSDLADGALAFWRYLSNRTVFGYSGKRYGKDMAMTVNPGIFLTFLPLCYLLLPQRKKTRFATICFGLGYVCFLLPGEWVPWNSLFFLRVLQFPWRLMTLASVLLCVPAAVFLKNLHRKNLVIVLTAVVLGEGLWHLAPVLTRSFGITSKTFYSDITGGKLCDPYYSASYMRVELAGGDYLPVSSPDFRSYAPLVRADGAETDLSYVKDGNTLSVTVSAAYENTEIEVPLTWYKGYRAYFQENGRETEITCSPDEKSLVSFRAESAGLYTVRYRNTPLRTLCILVSLLTALFLIVKLRPIKT